MKNMFKYMMIAGLASTALTGCTEQQRARQWGGTATLEVPSDKKLVNVTWKHPDELWVLTRERKPGEQPERYTFEESSSWGVLEGKVVIVEK